MAAVAELGSLGKKRPAMEWRKIDLIDLSNPEHKEFAMSMLYLCKGAAKYLGSYTVDANGKAQGSFSSGNIKIDLLDYTHIDVIPERVSVFYKEQIVVEHGSGFLTFRLGRWIDEVQSLGPRIAAAREAYERHQQQMKADENRQRFGKIDE